MFSSISGLYTIVIGHEPGSYQSLTYVTKGNTSIGGEQRKRKSKKNATKPSQDNQRKKKKNAMSEIATGGPDEIPTNRSMQSTTDVVMALAYH